MGTALTEKEAQKGMELVWVDSFEHAIELVHSAEDIDEDGSSMGLELMKIRETAILKFARQARL